MRKIFIAACFFFVALHSTAQVQGTVTNNNNAVSRQQDKDSQEPTEFVDSVYKFKIAIPSWWHIRPTPPNFFGGTFPKGDSIENALLIKCYPKTSFKDMADFENWVIRGYITGQKPKWSASHIIMQKTELDTFKKLGNAFKVQVKLNDRLYDCCYIVTQTRAGYIWIDFTAADHTYDKNFEKFKALVSGYQLL